MQWLEWTAAALTAAHWNRGSWVAVSRCLAAVSFSFPMRGRICTLRLPALCCCTASVPPALPSGSLAREGRTGLQMVAWEHGSPRPACTAGFLSIFCLRRFVFPVASRPGTFVRGPQHASRLPAFASLFAVAGLRWMLSWEISARFSPADFSSLRWRRPFALGAFTARGFPRHSDGQNVASSVDWSLPARG